MSIYPFYVEVNSSTRKTIEGVGCRSKDGDMTTTVYQRDKGAITTPFKIRQYSTEDLNEETGEWEHHLHTDVYYQGEVIKRHITDY